MHCLKYGLTVHNILKLRAWTISGELLEIGNESLDAAGYDLLALLTGSEGMLAVITEVTVKLLPRPERAQVVLAAFDDVAKAGAAVGNIIAAGVIPAGLEMMDRLAIQAAEAFVHAGYPLDCEALLLCEVDGVNEEVSADIFVGRARESGRSGPLHPPSRGLERQAFGHCDYLDRPSGVGPPEAWNDDWLGRRQDHRQLALLGRQ